MATMGKIAKALQGFGEGYRGRGQQFIQGIKDENDQNTLDDAYAVQQNIQQGNVHGARQVLLDRLKTIEKYGGDTDDTDRMMYNIEANNFDQLLSDTTNIVNYGIASNKLRDPSTFGSDAKPADLRTFEALVDRVNDPSTPDNVKNAINIKLGINPRATSPQVVDIGGVGHLWEPITKTLSPMSVNGEQITPETVGASKGTIAGATEGGKQAVTAGKEFFDKLGPVNTSIKNITNAINAIDSGANTGFIASKLPSVTEASIALDNIRGQMGLDIVGASTFGALSESELAFALDTAMPVDMEPKALRSWLGKKKGAQMKLRAELAKTARYLSTPGNTIGSYMTKLEKDGKYSPAKQGKYRSSFLGSNITQAELEQEAKQAGITVEQAKAELGIE